MTNKYTIFNVTLAFIWLRPFAISFTSHTIFPCRHIQLDDYHVYTQKHFNNIRPRAFTSNSMISQSQCETTKFDDMKSLERRIEILENSAPETIKGFYEPHLKSFSVRPGRARFSVTSTLFTLEAIMSSRRVDLYESIADFQLKVPKSEGSSVTTPKSNDKISIRDVVQETLMSSWRKEDLFQVPLLISVILQIDKKRELLSPRLINEDLADKIRTLISALLSARPMRRNGNTQPLSEYLLFQCTRAMATLNDATSTDNLLQERFFESEDDTQTEDQDANVISVGGLPMKAIPLGAASELSLGLHRCAEISFNELCKQLAFRISGDRTNFDIMRLAYSLLTYITSTNTLSGTAGFEMIPGNGPIQGTAVGQLNIQIVKEGLKAFFEEQNDDGLWDKGQPIYKSFRKQGRNVGNAFVYSIDTLGTLLCALPAEFFRPHMKSLEKALSWIESHQNVEIIANYCDPTSMKCYGKPLRGWSSPHVSPPETNAWATAQTIKCISEMRKVVRQLMNNDVLAEFGGLPNSDGPKLQAWERLLDTDLKFQNECRTLKCVLQDRMIKPFSEELEQPSYGAAYSAILFGPPGTAKTTICESLAERMGWNFLVIDTSAFLEDGLTNVAARIRYVFKRLMELERCVILFDEIEEFCLDRETPGLGMESRMLTTAMLTAINDLRRKKRSIFFLATNRLRAFDSAIIRPGRFDMQLFVGTPNLDARCIQFRDKLSKFPLDDDTKQKSERTYRDFLQSVWDEDSMFFNYLEGMQYASACADYVASGSELNDDFMASILKVQAAVITCRGTVRDEYIASMELSRL